MNKEINKRGLVLVVDDNQQNLDLAKDTLFDEGYEVLLARDGEEGLRLAQEHFPDVVLLDVMMPGIDGFEVCRRIKAPGSGLEEIELVLLTAKAHTEDKVKGLELGANDYLTKPYETAELVARVNTHVALYKARLELRNQNQILEEKVRERTQELRESRLEVVERLARTAELRDTDTGVHIIRMAFYSAELGRAAGLSPEDCELLLNAAPMHDIGKVGIQDSILLKPGSLTEEEFKIIQTHTTIGAKILSGSKSPLIQMAEKIALTHHEKWDGTGYPGGRKAEEIPFVGRIVAVCDVFDALTIKRPYKKAWPVDKAKEEIKQESNSHFEPRLVEEFEKIMPQILKIKGEFAG